MEQKKHFKKIIIALLMVGALVGFGYGVSTAVKHSTTPNSTVVTNSDIQMVPSNFNELAEKVRLGVVNIQVVKKIKNIDFGFRHFSGIPFGEKNPFGDFFGPFPKKIRPEVSNNGALGQGL
jgi:S1-C subfamily serine protease